MSIWAEISRKVAEQETWPKPGNITTDFQREGNDRTGCCTVRGLGDTGPGGCGPARQGRFRAASAPALCSPRAALGCCLPRPHGSLTAQAPLHLRLLSPQDRQRRPSPSPQPRARGHRAPARTAFASTSPSAATRLCPAQSLLLSLHSSREKRTPPCPRHPRHFPRPGPRSLTPTQQAQA